MQLRGTPGDVVIDINGYFAGVNDVLTNDDYISIVGSYDLGGGLLYVQNNSALGAAVNAFNAGNSAVMLAFGNRALSIQSGGIEVVGAGIQSATRTAMVHQVNTSAVYGNGAGARNDMLGVQPPFGDQQRLCKRQSPGDRHRYAGRELQLGYGDRQLSGIRLLGYYRVFNGRNRPLDRSQAGRSSAC